MTAIIKALEYILNHSEDKENNIHEYMLFADSLVSVQGLLGICSRNANRDLWISIESLCDNINNASITIDIKHVAAHQKEKDIQQEINSYADKLARAASKKLI